MPKRNSASKSGKVRVILEESVLKKARREATHRGETLSALVVKLIRKKIRWKSTVKRQELAVA